MKLLFPCNPLDNKKVDGDYLQEHHAAKLQGNDCFFFDHDEFVRGEFKSNIPQVDDKTPLVFRSWMLNVSQYEELYKILSDLGYSLVNTPEQYENCHHFPKSYDYIKGHTSKSIFIREWDESILQDISNLFGDKDFLMKDFVKSAKDVPGLFRMKSGITGEELLNKAKEFVEHRGKLFSEGLVFKEFVDLKRDEDDKLNEWRIFYYENRFVSSSPNSNQSGLKLNYPEDFIKNTVNDIAFQIDSNFFTIDVSEKSDGTWMIIEAGDGQVSGLSPNQNCLEFYASMEGQLK
jgi:hypothetical protein